MSVKQSFNTGGNSVCYCLVGLTGMEVAIAQIVPVAEE